MEGNNISKKRTRMKWKMMENAGRHNIVNQCKTGNQ